MQIDIITLFPSMFRGPLTESIINRAQKRGLVKIKIYQLRDWAINKYGQIDDRPYGGGAGMILRVDVVFKALTGLKFLSQKNKKIVSLSHCLIAGDHKKISERDNNEAMKQCSNKPYIVLPTPSGKKFDQALARKLAKKKHLVFLCPHYEGYDKRIESLVDEKISIGDYVLTGGEIPVMAMVDAIVRLIPGVINKESLKEESFSLRNKNCHIVTLSHCRGKQSGKNSNETMKQCSNAVFEYPQYTRPEIFEMEIRGKKVKKRVPKILLSGNHKKIEEWKKKAKRI